VGVAFFAVEEATHAELAGEGAVDRFVQQQVARGVRAEGAVGLDLLGQLALNALEVGRVRVDLLGVFQGDVLFRVLLVANGEHQVAPAAADLLGARLDRQRHADNGQPVVLFLYHQHRLALIAGLGWLRRGAQVHHRHAARHRFVEQASDVAVGVGVEGQAQEKQRGENARHGSIQ